MNLNKYVEEANSLFKNVALELGEAQLPKPISVLFD